MSKIGRLLPNELLKIFARRSVKIIFAAILVLIVVYHGVGSFTNRNNDRYRDLDYSMESLRSELEYYISNKPDGYEVETERIRLLIDNQINSYELNWRLDAVGDIANLRREQKSAERQEDYLRSQELEQQIAQKKEWVASQDYRSYYTAKIEETNLDPTLTEETRETLTEGYQYVLDYQIAASGSEWKYQLYSNIVNAKTELNDLKKRQFQRMSADPVRTEQLENSILVAEYRIENDRKVVAVNDDGNYYYGEASPYWRAFYDSGSTLLLASLFAIIAAALLLSGEFATGTVRAQLVVPVGRGKILIAKYLAVLLSALIVTVGLYLWNAAATGFFYGFSDIGAHYFYAFGDTVHEMSGFWPVLLEYLLLFVRVVVFATMGFGLAALFHNAAAPIAIGCLCAVAGPYACYYLRYSLNQDWAKYLLFTNLDLSTVLRGQENYYSQSLSFTLLVIGVHILVFLLTAWDAFVRRDIKL